jgi:hypothetical protein
LFLLGALLLTGCRLDVTVAVDIETDGTGTVTLVATADAELVAEVPTLIDDLRLDDAVANGWQVDGPTETADAGMTITLTHDVHSPEELANVLNSIGPPLTRMAAARTSDETGQTTNAINGELVLADGFATFADADLLQAVGGLPFGEQITASGLTPDQAMSFTFQAHLPGELIRAETGTQIGDGVIEWRAPLDGTSVNLYTQTLQRPPGSGNSWAEPLSKVALVALIGWVIASIGFIGFVVAARKRKQRRRMQALRRLERNQRVT